MLVAFHGAKTNLLAAQSNSTHPCVPFRCGWRLASFCATLLSSWSSTRSGFASVELCIPCGALHSRALGCSLLLAVRALPSRLLLQRTAHLNGKMEKCQLQRLHLLALEMKAVTCRGMLHLKWCSSVAPRPPPLWHASSWRLASFCATLLSSWSSTRSGFASVELCIPCGALHSRALGCSLLLAVRALPSRLLLQRTAHLNGKMEKCQLQRLHLLALEMKAVTCIYTYHIHYIWLFLLGFLQTIE